MRGQRSIAAVHISHLIQPFGWCASFMREIIFDVLTDNYDKTSPQHRFGGGFFKLFLQFVITAQYCVITNYQIAALNAHQTRCKS